jgi:pimeloyl-ACP methyl ester carboxylesterase
MKPPVVVIPGITATTLRDQYPAEPETVWDLLRKDYLRVALHPDDLRYEQIEPSLVRADEVFSIPYDEFVKELRHDLTEKRDRPRPVFLFGYDWRRPLEDVVEALRAFCDEVAARTALLKHYAKAGYTAADGQVDLVGHSMGGLLITGYLSKHPQAHRARKVATLGTPFCGSFEAVLKIITGTADLGSGVPKSREREVARITPSLYYLLPENHLKEAIEVDEGLPNTLFDVDLWQDSVLESIAEHIRLTAVDPPSSQAGRMDAARRILAAMLDEAAAFRQRTLKFRLADAGLVTDDWLAIVGVGEETRVELRVENRNGSPFYVLRSLGRKNGYPEPTTDTHGNVTAALQDTGDGTVPFWAATPPFLPSESLIAVSDEDFGYWELRDRLLERVSNLHGLLPSMNRVIKLTAAFLKAEEGEKGRAHDGIRGRRAPDVAPKAKWDPPIRALAEDMPKAMKALLG